MDFELRQAREKLEREQRERMQRAKAKAERESLAKAEAARRQEALEASHRERRLDAARAQEEVTTSIPLHACARRILLLSSQPFVLREKFSCLVDKLFDRLLPNSIATILPI
jgi:hypothetical protein